MRHDDDRTSRLLSEVVDGTAELDPDEWEDLEHDLRFQAELVQYRRLLRDLRSMRSEVRDPGPAFVDGVLVHLHEAVERGAVRGIMTGRRAAYLGGLAAATAAGVGSAIVLARRHRRLAA